MLLSDHQRVKGWKKRQIPEENETWWMRGNCAFLRANLWCPSSPRYSAVEGKCGTQGLLRRWSTGQLWAPGVCSTQTFWVSAILIIHKHGLLALSLVADHIEVHLWLCRVNSCRRAAQNILCLWQPVHNTEKPAIFLPTFTLMTVAFTSTMYATGLLSNKQTNIDRTVRKYTKVHAPKKNKYKWNKNLYSLRVKSFNLTREWAR